MFVSQKLHEAFKGTVERITNPRTISAFKEKGLLSISEFLIAGDNLVSKCPTWSWESGERSKRKSYPPTDKQYLVTRNDHCLRRDASIEEEYEAAGGKVSIDDEDNDGWLATHGKPKGPLFLHLIINPHSQILILNQNPNSLIALSILLSLFGVADFVIGLFYILGVLYLIELVKKSISK